MFNLIFLFSGSFFQWVITKVLSHATSYSFDEYVRFGKAQITIFQVIDLAYLLSCMIFEVTRNVMAYYMPLIGKLSLPRREKWTEIETFRKMLNSP